MDVEHVVEFAHKRPRRYAMMNVPGLRRLCFSSALS